MDETMSELFLVFLYGLLVTLPLLKIVGRRAFTGPSAC